MFVETSVLVAIALKEEDAETFIELILEAPVRRTGATEASLVMLGRLGYAASLSMESLVMMLEIDVVPFAEEHAALALQAYARFGKGQKHAAQLNFGDCLSYALAKASDQPLLFKGRDFSLTDLLIV